MAVLPIIHKVQQFIQQEKLISPGQQVLLACSGGADSVFLAEVLVALNIPFQMAHCNFKLRGKESTRDEKFVIALAKRLNKKLWSVSFDTEAVAKQHGWSIEMAARHLRYEWFQKLLSEQGLQVIVTAHHLDDRVETIFMNFIKGAGLSGMQGLPTRNGNIVRPLLCVRKEEILSYLQLHKIKFVEDSSNLLNDFQRNQIRNVILPEVKKVNDNYTQAILQWNGISADAEKMVSYIIDREFRKQLTEEGKISIPLLLEKDFRKLILFHLLYPLGFHPDTISEIEKSLTKSSGKIFVCDAYKLVKDREFLLLQPNKQTEADAVFIESIDKKVKWAGKTLTFKKIKKRQFCSKQEIMVDADKLVFPMEIRKMKPGDVFCPFGMNRRKKIKKFFIDEKLNLFEKQTVSLLVNGNGEICWVIGYRADNRYRIEDNTKNILLVSLT